jgi:CheY-like chemotaxis protein
MTGDLSQELDAPRARFIAELGERISTLRQSLARFGSGAEPAGELNALRRRVHALAAGADVLRFTRAAEALALAETGLAGAGGWDPGAPARERVARILDLLPSLVLGAPIDLAAELDNPRLEPLREPLCVVVYADASLESLLHKPGVLHGIESHATRQPDQAIELVTQLSPDVLLVDGDDPDVSEILPRLRQASGSRHAPVVAVGSFDQPEALLRSMRRGVSRVLPKPTDAVTLQRTLRQVTLSESSTLQRPVNYRKLSQEELADAIGAEARRAFLNPAAVSPTAVSPTAVSPAAVSPAALHASATLDLGSNAEAQAALWAAFARLRALAARNTPGGVSLPREGPGGATLLAPDAPAAPSSRPASAPVPLHGRRLIVADDDPAVRTLLSNALAELGATVLPARDGAEALDLAERHWPDALVSDTLMPQLDGFELCRRLRQDIALSDLPVLLVAWKDHLLACTRSPAQGRALDQIDGASLTLALRDCLAPRASLEQRLARHDAVHGRLDGLTPRLLLQMVCSRSPNALLSLRSGRLTFEFSVADGRPVHARWYDGEQPRGEGKPVLGPFLGVRAGRFSVEPLFSPPPAHFDGDAMAVLNPAALRARRARELLSPNNLPQVERVLLDPLASEHYAAEFPTQAALLSQLGATALGGTDALRRLVADDQAGSEPGRLSALLAELARSGAIGALLDRDGNDLLPGGAAFHPPSSPLSAAGRAWLGRSASSRPPGSAPITSALEAAALEPAAAAAARPSAPAPGVAAGSKPPSSVALGEAVLGAASAPPTVRAASEPSFEPDAATELVLGGPPEEGIAHQADVARAAFDGAEQPEQPFFSAAAAATDPAPPPEADSSPPPAALADEESSAAPFERVTSATRARADRALSDPGSAARSEDSELSGNGVTAVDASAALANDDESAWPPSAGARLRSALGRGLLSLGAAAVAFLAIRALASRSWDPQHASLPGTTEPASGATLAARGDAVSGLPASGLPASGLPAGGKAASGVETTPAAQRSAPGADAGARSGTITALLPLKFDSELLELAPGTKLPPGQGALEIRSPRRQRIYVDGVLMGDDEERLIPLGPGTYQLRLNDGTRDVERALEVKAGRRTRISARPSSAP